MSPVIRAIALIFALGFIGTETESAVVQEFFSGLRRSNATLAFFLGNNCILCDTLEKQVRLDGLDTVKIDVDKQPLLHKALNITALPAVVAFSNGNEKGRVEQPLLNEANVLSLVKNLVNSVGVAKV